MVTVITEAHGMEPTQVESQVTFPIESSLNGASGVRRVRSSTAVGISIVWVDFEWGTDIYKARQIVTEKLQTVAASLPAEVEKPILAPVSSIMGEIMFIALSSETHSPIELRTTADLMIRRRLLAIPGIAQVMPIGGGVKQYQVVLYPPKMWAYDVSLGDVLDALESSNRNVSAGVLNEGGSEFLVTGWGRLHSTEEIAEIVVAARDHVPIRVADLGEVRVGAAIKRGAGSVNARPAVVMGIQKQPDANSLELTQEVDRVLEELHTAIPVGMEINKRLFRQSDFIEVAVQNVEEALRDGGILVIVVLFVFLANIRASIITLVAIPLLFARGGGGAALDGRNDQHDDARGHGDRHRFACRRRRHRRRETYSGDFARTPLLAPERRRRARTVHLRGKRRDPLLDRLRDAHHRPCIRPRFLSYRRRGSALATFGDGLCRLPFRFVGGCGDGHAGSLLASPSAEQVGHEGS